MTQVSRDKLHSVIVPKSTPQSATTVKFIYARENASYEWSIETVYLANKLKKHIFQNIK